MKIVLINVKYSPNLGDGAIAECLEAEILKQLPEAQIHSLDIGGRHNYGDGGSIMGRKLSMMQEVDRLPRLLQKSIRQFIVPVAMSLKYNKSWSGQIRSCDALVIGGGQLFMDVDQYFPRRISKAVRLARKGVPIAVYAVGVANKWTMTGLRLLHQGFEHGRLIYSAVRDTQSQQYWADHVQIGHAVLTQDPALLAADHYGPFVSAQAPGGRKTIALGVSDPADLKLHAEKPTDVVCADFSFYLEMVERLYGLGFDIALFNNGADQIYLERVSGRLASLNHEIQQHVKVLPKAKRPVELVAQIASADAVVAHRLHANILAYSYAIPHVGLVWDMKLKYFFRSVDRENYLVMSDVEGPEHVIAKVQQALAEGIDRTAHARIIAEARHGIERLTTALVASQAAA